MSACCLAIADCIDCIDNADKGVGTNKIGVPIKYQGF